MSGSLDIGKCINDACPNSGKPVRADSLTMYKGNVVGFCNPDCRDHFENIITKFDASLGN
jgi:hypothetical protein